MNIEKLVTHNDRRLELKSDIPTGELEKLKKGMRPGPSNRLNSWKEIAHFLECSERTARRWEDQRSMPVHRLPGGAKGSVFAYADELENWLNSASEAEPETPAQPEDAAQPANSEINPIRLASKWPRVLMAATIVVACALLLFASYPVGELRLAQEGPLHLPLPVTTKMPPLLTDGRNLYYQELIGGRFQMTRTSLAGTWDSHKIDTPLGNPDPGVVAPDGSAMLLRDITGSEAGDQPLYLQPLPEGIPRRLGEIFAYDSAWTPDRKHIIFSKLHSIYEATTDGVVTRKLFDVPGRAHQFRFSPNGRILRFTVYDSKDSTWRIWETSSSYATPPRLIFFGLDKLPQQCCGNWDAKGAYYVFQAQVNGTFQVFGYKEGGLLTWVHRPATQLTSGPVSSRSPLPSSDSGRLLMLSRSARTEIVQFERSSQRWLPLFEGAQAKMASFSRDGKWVAFVRPNGTLWKCEMPGCTAQSQLLEPLIEVAMPVWSPDGGQIACMTRAPGQQWSVGVISAGGGKRILLPSDGKPQADPTWSPSGEQIAFGTPANPDTGAESQIQVVDLASRLVRVVNGSKGLNTPRWSPDGRYMAAVRWGNLELVLCELSTGMWRAIKGSRAGYLNWSGDSKLLYYWSTAVKGHPQVASLEVSTWRSAVVAGLSEIRQPGFSFGDWIGLSPSGAPLALRDLGASEILSWKIDR